MRVARSWKQLPFHWLIPFVFFCIGLLYIYAAPHFEASDNEFHVGVIKWIVDTGELPVQTDEHDYLYGHEANQPPLYYLTMAPIYSAFDTTDFSDYFLRNPLVLFGHPKRLGNRNFIFYRQPYPPDLAGVSLALYVIRLLTLGMAVATVAAVYQSARTIMPGHVGFAVLATSLVAFNPMFLFISTSISNDVMATALSSLAAWQMLVMLRHGFDSRRSLFLAILIAGAALAKLNGLVTLPVVGLAGVLTLFRTRDRRGFIILGIAVSVVFLAAAGWWFARNLSLYGELFGTKSMLDYYGRRSIALSRMLTEEFQSLRISYWGLFGKFSILTHDLYYHLTDALSLMSVGGLLVFLAKNRKNSFLLAVVSLLSVFLAIGSAILIWFSLQVSATYGRHLFPSIISISVLMAMGLITLRIPPLLVVVPMLLFSLASPFVYIMPQYDHPPIVAEIPESATKSFARWGDTSLVGYELPPPRRWAPGDEIPLTLYWQPSAQTKELQALFLTLIDADGEAIATIDSFPGWGTLPTMWWAPGQIYKDDYILQIPPDAQGYTTVQLHIGWYPFPDGSNIWPLLESGRETAAFILPLGALVAGKDPNLLGDEAASDDTVFGQAIRLTGHLLREDHILELEWQILEPISGAWRVFAIILAEPYQEGAPVEALWQRDAVPAVPLGYLKADERFVTRHDFELPPGYQGEHVVYVGWYNENLLQRLPVAHPSNMLPLPLTAFRGPAA